MTCFAGILITLWHLSQTDRYGKRPFVLFTVALVLTGFSSIFFITSYWETLLVAGSASKRVAMYSLAIEQAIRVFPLGGGFSSSEILLDSLPEDIARSIHNWFLAYLVELGAVGALGFSLILVSWFRDVLFATVVHHRKGMSSLSFAPVAIFSGYNIVILFQPVPVRRYWWIIFALSLAVVRRTETAKQNTSTSSSTEENPDL
jgi:hypothetical protein